MELSRTALAATFLALFLPATVAADDYCVDRTGCPPANTFGAGSLQAALDAAAAHPNTGPYDRVLIGPGTYVSPAGFTYDSPSPVEVIGAGEGEDGTVIAGTDPNAANQRLLTVLGSNPHRVSALRFDVAAGSNNIGLRVHGEVRDVTVVGRGEAPAAMAIDAQGQTTIERATIRLPLGEGAGDSNIGVRALGGVFLRLRDSTIAAQIGVSTTSDETAIQRADVISNRAAVSTASPNARVESSLLRPVGDGTGLRVRREHSNVSFALANVTIAGVGNAVPVGIDARTRDDDETVGGSLHSTIVRGVQVPIRAATSERRSSTSVFIEYSDLDPSANLETGPGTEAIDFGAGNRTTGEDPRWVALGGPRAYRLRTSSPLIDAGAPFAIGTESPIDLAGTPRILDGNGDGGARRDIGAFEYDPSDPPAEPVDPAPESGAAVPVSPAGEAPAPDPQQIPGPAQPERPRRGFEFASIRRRGKGFDLSVKLANRLNEPVNILVQTTERIGYGKKKPLFRYRPVRRTIKPGGTLTVTLKAPKRLKAALNAQLAKRGRIVRKPRIAVRDLATGGSEALAQKFVMRKR